MSKPNAKLIVALTNVTGSIAELIEALNEESDSVPTPAEKDDTPKEKKRSLSSKKSKPADDEKPIKDEEPSESGHRRRRADAGAELPAIYLEGKFAKSDLEGLAYNQLKRLAKELGISGAGSRDDLIESILSANIEEKPTPKKETKAAPSKARIGKKKPVEEPADEEPPEEEEEPPEEEEDPVVAKVNEAIKDLTDEEILETLTSVGVKARGKRQALIEKVIEAVKSGKLVLDDDEDEDTSDEQSNDDEDTSEGDEDEDEIDDKVNDPSNPNLTKARKKGIEKLSNEIVALVKSKKLSRKQMEEWLNEYAGEETDFSDFSTEDVLDSYIFYNALFVDDEGDVSEKETPYSVNGEPFCCGHQLKYNEDDETFICETCGGEYDASEDE